MAPFNVYLYVILIMILKYWSILFGRQFKVSKLIYLHFPFLIVGFIYLSYLLRHSLLTQSVGNLAHFLSFYFMFQVLLLWVKGGKSGLYFSAKCYVLFPQSRIKLLLYDIALGVMDLNLLLFTTLVPLFLMIMTDWSIWLKCIFLISFILAEITMLLVENVFIRIINTQFGQNKNLYMLGFYTLFFIELITRLTEKPEIFYYFPLSGWAGSMVFAAYRNDYLNTVSFICLFIIITICLIFYLNSTFYPRENDANL